MVGHGVQTSIAPGVAPPQTLERKVASEGSTVPFNGPDGINRTAGLEATGRTEPWAQKQAVCPHNTNEQPFHFAGVMFIACAIGNLREANRPNNC